MLRIFGFPTFNVAKVIMTAEELSLNYQFVHLNPMHGEHKTSEYLLRHPAGKVPAIEHDGRPLFESAAIGRYFASLSETDLYPRDPYDRGVVDQWLDYSVSAVGKSLTVFFWEKIVQPKYYKKEPNQKALEEASEALSQQFPVLEEQLGCKKFLAFDHFTLADIYAFCHIDTHSLTGVDISGYPNLKKWHQGILQRKSMENVRKYCTWGEFEKKS